MNMYSGEFRYFDDHVASTYVDPSEFRAVSRAVDAEIARPVLGVTPVEGRAASLRVHIPDGNLIATRNHDRHALKREAKILRKLWNVGAPVPRYIAISEDFLFEEDLGSRNLTAMLATVDHSRRYRLMEAAFAGLYSIKSVARKAKFRKPPALSHSNPDWLMEFVCGPQLLSEYLGIEPPELDYSAMMKSLDFRASKFVKWGARPCHALVGDDGSVSWVDWKTAGLGAGYEDIGFLISDENWPFEPTASLALYRRFQWNWTPHAEANLCIFAALRTCHRLRSIGQANQEDVSMQIVRRLVAHGSSFAKRSVLMRHAEPWFECLASERIWGQKFALQPGLLGIGADRRT